MIDKRRAKGLVRKLIHLTSADKMRWYKELVSNWNNYGTKFEKWDFSTEWLQDGKPTLWVNDFKIEGHYYGIQALIQAIEEQRRRLKVDVYYSDKETRRRKLNADLARKAEAARDEKLNRAMNEFLQADN